MRFSVGKKIGLGFGIVLVLLLTVFVITIFVVRDAERTLKKSIETNDKFLNIDQPSVFQLNILKKDLTNAHMFMQQWMLQQSSKDAYFKVKANELIDSLIPEDTLRINLLTKKWTNVDNSISLYDEVKKEIKNRDKRDLNRKTAPLKPDVNSVLLDTSYLDIEQSFNTIKIIINH